MMQLNICITFLYVTRLQVQFNIVVGGRSLSRQLVLEHTTVKELIESCCRARGIKETKDLYAVLYGKTLSDEELPSHYPIHHDSTVNVICRLMGGE